MTASTLTVPRSASRSLRHARRSPVLALARVEGRRLIRNPIVLGSIPFCAGAYFLLTMQQAPVMSRDDVSIAAALCPLAGAVFLAANLATTRSARHGADELFGSTVTATSRRTLGHLVSVLWSGPLSLLLVAAALLYLVLLHPVGRPDPVELLIGPATVLMAGALGVGLARWWRSAVAGPVGVVALLGIEVMLGWQISAGRPESVPNPGRWLAPWVPLSVSGSPARELVIRPSGWHVVYLLAVGGLAAAIAVVRTGASPRRLVSLGAAVAIVVGAGAAQVHEPSAADKARMLDLVVHPRAHQVCQTHSGVLYCAYRSYAGWIDRWAAAITPVLDRVPVEHRPDGLKVIQTLNVFGSQVEQTDLPAADQKFGFVDMTGAITPADRWARGPLEAQDQLALDLLAAAESVGLPRGPQDIRLTASEAKAILDQYERPDRAEAAKEIRAGGPWGFCSSAGQARAVVAMWLAAQATPKTDPAFRAIVRSDPYQVTTYGAQGATPGSSGSFGFTGSLLPELDAVMYQLPVLNPVVHWGKVEAAYAVQLLDRPAGEVTAALARDWNRLTDPSTATAELVRALGLRPLPSLEQMLARAGLDPARAKILRAQEVDPMEVPCR